MLAWIFGDCREGQIPRCLQRCKFDTPLLAAGSLIIVWIGYQVGKIYRKYCWDIISIMVAIMSTAIVIYFGEWIKSILPINLIALLLLVHVVYIGIICYVKDWLEKRGYY